MYVRMYMYVSIQVLTRFNNNKKKSSITDGLTFFLFLFFFFHWTDDALLKFLRLSIILNIYKERD